MNKFILLFLSLFSLSSYAKDSDINICKTVENIKDLYSSNLNYSGITLDLLKKGNIYEILSFTNEKPRPSGRGCKFAKPSGFILST